MTERDSRAENGADETGGIGRRRWAQAQAHEASFWQGRGVFENEFARVQTRYGPVISELDRGLAGAVRILDVGSGPTCAARLFMKGRKTYLDPLMPAYARRWPDCLPDGDCLAGTGERLPHPTNTFDVVVSFNSLDHSFKPWEVLAEMRRVLKPGGILLLGIFCHPPILAAGRRGIERLLPFLKDTPHPFSFTRASVERLVGRYFAVRETRCVYRKASLLPSLHRKDWILICENKKGGGR